MTRQYPQLERGESAAETGRDHIPPRVFKQMARLNKQKERLEALLDGVNLLNYKARAQQIGEVLDRYLPDVAKMRAQLKRYNIAFTDTMAENQALKAENAQLNARLEQTRQRSFAKQLEDAKLRKTTPQPCACWSASLERCWTPTPAGKRGKAPAAAPAKTIRNDK